MNLTITYITARREPHFEWFVDSITNQILPGDDIELFCVDLYAKERNYTFPDWAKVVEPKPSVWQGKHRLTKEDWWAASNARNTGICHCTKDWIAFVDDRCVLVHTWLEAVRDAMEEKYAVCGAYEKRHNMKVDRGIIIDHGTLDGKDHREDGGFHKVPGSWWYGCTTALPLEWSLQINGYNELMDGLSCEDCVFGMMLENNKFPIQYDPRMKVIQDRTPGLIGPAMKRTSKERFPNDNKDKGHEALRRFSGLLASPHDLNLRELRNRILRGEAFPVPTEPTRDWFDNQPLAEM